MGIKKDYDDLTPSGQVARLKKEFGRWGIYDEFKEYAEHYPTGDEISGLHGYSTADDTDCFILLERLRKHKLSDLVLKLEDNIIDELTNIKKIKGDSWFICDLDILQVLFWVETTSGDVDISFLIPHIDKVCENVKDWEWIPPRMPEHRWFYKELQEPIYHYGLSFNELKWEMINGDDAKDAKWLRVIIRYQSEPKLKNKADEMKQHIVLSFNHSKATIDMKFMLLSWIKKTGGDLDLKFLEEIFKECEKQYHDLVYQQEDRDDTEFYPYDTNYDYDRRKFIGFP